MYRDEQRTMWPEYKGINVDKAIENIKKENPELNVYKVATDEMVTMDYRTDRVRVYYDRNTNLVVTAPTIG